MRDFASCYNEHAVKVSDSSCSGGGGGSTKISPRDLPVQSSITCLYRARLSTQKEFLVRVTWCKNLIGQGLSIGIDHNSSDTSTESPTTANPTLLRKKKGSRSFVSGGSVIGLYWDISSAKYDSSPEPVQGFYVVVIADAEFAVLVGDMSRDQINKFEEPMPTAEFSLVSRSEQVLGNSLYSTKTRFRDNGRDHEISIRCKGDGRGDSKESELSVCIDKKKVVHVRRLKWNFRGNQTIFVDGLPVDMMWDVHDWWFSGGGASGHAVFMFRTRSGLESRLWLEEEFLQRSNSRSTSSREEGGSKSYGFSLLIHAFRSGTRP